MAAKVSLQLFLVLLLQLVCYHATVAANNCPAQFLLRKQTLESTSSPRRINEKCCSDADACKCAEGLMCCTNARNEDVCIDDPCVPNPCGELGRCTSTRIGRPFCHCFDGAVKLKGACVDNPCDPNPCTTGRCIVESDGNEVKAVCSCDPGLSGDSSCTQAAAQPSSTTSTSTTPTPSQTTTARSTTVRSTTARSTTARRVSAQTTATQATISGTTAANVATTTSSTTTASTTTAIPEVTEAQGTTASLTTESFIQGFAGDIENNTITNSAAKNVNNTVNLCPFTDCGFGTCEMREGLAFCVCTPGAVFNGTTCINPGLLPQIDPCLEHDCGAADCEDRGGRAFCNCHFGAFFNGSECIQVFDISRFPVPEAFTYAVKTATTPSVRCDPEQTPSTIEAGETGNRTFAAGTTSGCLKSQRYPDSYLGGLFDEVVIKNTGFDVLKVNIQEMGFETAKDGVIGEFSVNDCVRDYMFVAGQLYCGSLTQEKVVEIPIKGQDEVVIGLTSEFPLGSAKGFLLRWELHH